MTTELLLRQVGEALYGSRWQTEMGLELGVTNRSVRRWLTGICEPQAGVWVDLEQLLSSRMAEQNRVRQMINQHRAEAFR